MRLINRFWNTPFVAGSFLTVGLIILTTLLIHFIYGVPFSFFLIIPFLVFIALILDRWLCHVPIKFGMKVLSCLLFYPLCSYRRWDQITHNLYLGALPLRKHLSKLVHQEKISSVLSMTEEFELETGGFFFKPISSKDWATEGVRHEMIEAKDCTKLTEKHIEKAVRFIAQEIEKGKKVYVHCQAGIERSVTVAAAYLVHAGITKNLKDSLVYLRKFRPHAMLTKRNEEALKNWFATHSKGKGLKGFYKKIIQLFKNLSEKKISS
jgi:protein-tyrosine phosphatase